MESTAQKIIKLIVIGAAWAIGIIVPPYVTIEPPLQLAIRAIFVVLPVLIYGRKSASSLLKILWDFCDDCIKRILEFNEVVFDQGISSGATEIKGEGGVLAYV